MSSTVSQLTGRRRRAIKRGKYDREITAEREEREVGPGPGVETGNERDLGPEVERGEETGQGAVKGDLENDTDEGVPVKRERR